MKTSGTLIKTQGKTLGEMLYENDPGKLSALDIACIKKNRVIAAQFTSEEVIANTPHSPQPSNSILESSEKSNTNFAEADTESQPYSSDDSAYWESMPEDSEQRKKMPPNLGDENTVFAEEGDKSYALRDKTIPTREELEAKEDIPVVDIREETSGSYKEQRDAFLSSEEAQALYREPALNRDTNEPLFIIPASITHTFSNAGQENIQLAKHIREIAESAVLTHGEASRNAPDDHTTGVYKFFGAVQTTDGVQPVKLTVKEYSVDGQDIPRTIVDYKNRFHLGDTFASIYDGKVLVLEGIEKETSSSAASSTQEKPAPDNHPSVSIISVKDLLDLVKGKDVQYIPQREKSNRSSADTDTDTESYSSDDSAYWESMPEDRELRGTLAAMGYNQREINTAMQGLKLGSANAESKETNNAAHEGTAEDEVLTINKDGTQSFKTETSQTGRDSATNVPSNSNVSSPAPVVNTNSGSGIIWSRSQMDSEKRKKTPPNLGDEDVVFADNRQGRSYNIDEGFADAAQKWYDETKPEQRATSHGYFHIGTTSDALTSIGARADNIYMRKYKIGTILEDHPNMSIDVIKQVPQLLETPVLIMKSRTQPDSIVLLGDLRATNNDTVLAALQLTPTPGGGTEAEFSLVTSAYDRSITNIQNLIRNSELLYLDPNKNRTNNWLMHLRVQFPSGQPPFGSIGTISYDDDGVNIQGKTLKELGVEMTVAPDLDSTQKSVSEIPDEQKTPMQKALEDALKKRADTDTESQPYSTDDSAYWESMPEDQELLRSAAARDDANPEVTAWGKKQERIETLDRKANNLREAMQENETKARREPGTSL